jgi:hypothetical protein
VERTERGITVKRRLASRFERLGVEAPPQRFKALGRFKNHDAVLIKISFPSYHKEDILSEMDKNISDMQCLTAY